MLIRKTESIQAIRLLLTKSGGTIDGTQLHLYHRGKHLTDDAGTLETVKAKDGDRIIITLSRSTPPVLTGIDNVMFQRKQRKFVGHLLFGTAPKVPSPDPIIEDFTFSQVGPDPHCG